MNKSSVMFALCTLSACSGYRETFDCAPGKGVGCTSLSAVNRMVEGGKLPVLDDSDKKEEEERKIKMSETIHLPKPAKNRLRVWMAPYQDSAGYDHEGAYVLGKPRHD